MPTDPVAFYRVEKMKFAGKRPNIDKTTVIYNNITISGIPLAAYDYVVNGKPGPFGSFLNPIQARIGWLGERQIPIIGHYVRCGRGGPATSSLGSRLGSPI